MELKEPLGTKLRKLRDNKNLSQSDVARQLHITRQAISAWENGKSQPDKEILMQLCNLYNTSMDELYEVKKTVEKTDVIVSESNSTDSEAENTVDNRKLLCTFEQVCLAALAAIFGMFPYIGVIAPIGIMIWMFAKKKRYPIVFIVCIAALIIGINNTLVITGQIFDIGKASIEKIN